MLSYVQAAILGFLQGITELFPISSLGHSVLVPQILHWNIDQTSSTFLGFVVMTHLATALVLVGFFWRDWARIIAGFARSIYWREITERDSDARLAWLLVVSTIPAGVIGLFLQNVVQQLFGAGLIVAGALMCNGIMLYSVEALKDRIPNDHADDGTIARISWKQAFWIGITQALALIPGISRTGITMTGGLTAGLSHENAARYSFLLATPIILAASALKVLGVFKSGAAYADVAIVGALSAAIAAYVALRFLTKYFETQTLKPFAAYCFFAGIIALIIIR